ncbi:hypothetical protein [Prosthecobacter sp.]|uniref:hypothetical protein n=1 Tax=Prosthecobacter sp. TaxID=1965333 RepID=UPI002489E8F5|nr:hypothetical protein [Prosthecobacter sp.]MDI1313278.1 hypothetical protein [Prosthecobacter sp.]
MSDMGEQLVICVLEAACKLMGGTNAWVRRNSGDCCQIVAQHNSTYKNDSSLNTILFNAAQQIYPRPVLLKTGNRDTLLCVCLSDGNASDGFSYMFGMLIAGPFELTERLAGIVDGLRCSLHTLIWSQASWQMTEGMKEQQMLAVTCSLCRRRHTTENGWMHWDDFLFLKTGRASSHTVCEPCALALYGEILQDTI